MKILIDSSILIDHFRTFSIKRPTLFTKLSNKFDKLYFSLITVGEVFSGKSSIEMELKILETLELGEILKIDFDLMKRAGELRRETGISLVDSIIATSTLELDLRIATLNLKDFKKVKGLQIYKI
ncbi:hypothetical protein A2954_01330 [Candidatus Roizmanbacteria bacterium RIFCSPLOWO2_01_FULL_37_12]|uniref:PIN domain-containing protein n=1 Tax=Candidatus Roizmanbacteria bacterium RIFCSPLOWO2_01_FULL_37_12 TaxID=1802056 RepID=A0A1F7IGI1_9BACT|nr:MAG: hypothetical protein A3D76_05960 [Candidatus Roizmanbacteria bacterium RIFCSPHIGHO2_02_FULL_37_9b]OGK42467.1 MAG: hypothetical protein A2954_01330 [Candidatus Roizmanbacteria bacterium RIFCSPLOWO2_01_FULL_37_12]